MLRVLIVLLGLLPVWSFASAEDTLLRILSNVKYVGLETNEALAGFELHFYPPDQYAQNVASVR